MQEIIEQFKTLEVFFYTDFRVDRYSGKDVEAWRNKELTQPLHGIVNLLGVEIPKDDFHVTGNYW